VATIIEPVSDAARLPLTRPGGSGLSRFC